MATVDATPHTHTEERVVEREGSNTGLIVLVIVLIILAFLVYYGFPALNNIARNANPGTQITVPDKIDVNVNNPGGQQPAPQPQQ